MVGGGVGHFCVVVKRFITCHKLTSSYVGEKLLPFAASRRVVAMCGFADRGYEEPGRPEGLPHTATIERISGASATATVFWGR